MTDARPDPQPRNRPIGWLVVLAVATAWPIANLLHNNWSMLVGSDLTRAAAWWVAIFVAAAIFALGLSRLIRGIAFGSIALAISCGVVLFFLFEWAIPHLAGALGAMGMPRRMANAVYLVVALLVVLVVLFATRSAALRRIVATFVVVGGAMTIGLLAADFVRTGWHDARIQPAQPVNSTARAPTQRPNVFLVVLDGYSRADVLANVARFDNGAFLAALRERRFSVVAKATSNYPVTYLSVSSLLAMDYLAVPEQPPFTTRGRFYDVIQGNNPWVASFQSMGYRYVHSGNVWGGSSCSGREDFCLNSLEKVPTREIDLSIIQMTPFRLLLPTFVTTTERGNLDAILGGLDSIYQRAPFFFFGHTMPPHPPFERGADCSKRKRMPSLEWWSSAEEYRDSTLCVNQQLIKLLDQVIARDPEVLIVLLSDHGSGFGKQTEAALDQWTDAMIAERFSTFLAMRMPAKCREQMPDNLSNVNVGRFVVACVSATAADYRPDRFFTGGHERHRSFGHVHEITDRIKALNLR